MKAWRHLVRGIMVALIFGLCPHSLWAQEQQQEKTL